MMKRTLYAAVGHFRCKRDSMGRSYPVVVVNRKENLMDMQEMMVWTALCWRVSDFAELERKYDALAGGLPAPGRTLEFCLERLQTRGLVARGQGDTDFDALYDLLGGLYVVPVSERLSLRLITVLNLMLFRGVPWRMVRILFRRDRRDDREAQVMALSKQALLSVAELVKCAEVGAEDVSTDRKLLDALYDDADSTSANLPFTMRGAASAKPVTMAVANLYLRKQIVLERL